MNKKEFLKYCEISGAFKGEKLNASFIPFLKNRPNLIKNLNSLVSGETISEQLFLLRKKRTFCEVCGKPTTFRSFGEGYNRFCSKECRRISMNENLEKTMLGKYGVKRPAQDPEIKAKMDKTLMKNHGVKNANDLKTKPSKPNIEKAKKTNLERYGVEHPLQNKEIRKKVAKTNLKKYGNVCSLQNEEVQREMRRKHFEEYVVEYPSQRPEVKEKIRQSRLENTYRKLLRSNRLKGRVIPLFKLEDFKGVNREYEFKCTKCGNVFKDNLIDGGVPRCLVCYPLHQQSRNPMEDEIVDFIKSIVPDEVITTNDREVLLGKELDIYLPNRNLAIEFNELYFHSELMGRGKYYHLSKTVHCEERNIHLLHIFEDEWLDKRDIVESIIASRLGVYERKLNARDLVVSFDEDTKEFFEENHLQGNAPSSIKVSLLEGNEIVAAISLMKPRYNKEADYELIRFAVKKGYNIRGGFSKLLSHFRRKYPGSIITFSERRLFDGNVYRVNGFEDLGVTPPGYWYSKGKTREDRMKYQKHRIKDADPNLTEYQNMQLKGYYRIWNCGNWKFKIKDS